MKIKILYLTLVLLLPSTLLADAENGKVLYDKANCAQCHSGDIFTNEDRKITNFKKLKKRVKWCAFQHDAPWFDKEVLDVVDYLNHHFYKFPKKN